MSTDNAQVELDPTVDFIAGTIAGMAGLIVGFPFDTVKVRFQNPTTAGRYHSTLHTIATITREERFIGLYKGITSPLVMVAFMNGVVFASYRFFMKIQLPNAHAIPTLTQITLAGMGSGIVSSIVTTPTELIKIRQQSLLVPTSTRQVALQILKEHGITGLYRGITATALRDCGYGAYFAAYEATCRHFAPPPPSLLDPSNIYAQAEGEINKLSWSAMLLAGGIAGIAGWVFTFPFDVVKTRVQSTTRDDAFVRSPTATTTSLLGTPTLSSVNPYRSTWSTILYSYRTEGFRVFFHGLTPTLIRSPSSWVILSRCVDFHQGNSFQYGHLCRF